MAEFIVVVSILLGAVLILVLMNWDLIKKNRALTQENKMLDHNLDSTMYDLMQAEGKLEGTHRIIAMLVSEHDKELATMSSSIELILKDQHNKESSTV